MAQFSIPPHPDIAARRGAVLVVEDRDDVRQGMAQLLELHGFLVEDVRDAEEALTQLHTEPGGFALILLDLLLPGGLSGWDFRARQLADPTIADIPTIVVTVADDIDLEKRDALRFDGWLEKPFRCADLLEAVRHYVVSEGSALQAES
jgi:CheY-like chemotaxis protein